MKRTVLFVDDNECERTILRGFLCDEYDLIEASGGEEAISILNSNFSIISAVILDLVMPGMDGFEVLKQLRSNSSFLFIPVIITTVLDDEKTLEKAVAFGANGFIKKPFSRDCLVNTIKNYILLSETSSMSNNLWKDKLTGLLNRESFFAQAEWAIKRENPGYYVISCLDVENFKFINDRFGTEVGDKVLKHISNCVNDLVSKLNGLACRFSADRFAIIFPSEVMNDYMILNNHIQAMTPDCIDYNIRIRIGRYIIDNNKISISDMYDRAIIAQESIKGRTDVYISNYNDDMRNKLLNEQQLVENMDRALNKGEFEPWFQPQYNHATGSIIGAEALVRWNKDDKYILPSDFIPVFERNGFIYELDKYIWERVCSSLRKWIDEGLKPLPVSVNVSRRDLLHNHFIETITGIIKKYNIPYHLIRLEVTESAFAESSGKIVKKVDELIKLGFTVEIDDFGSGYSSLNTLKDVPASILKLDLKFFENTENTQRSGNIVESVVRMAKWLGMAVIAEGVEEKAQADYLKSIGCYYIQGYYYAKPMPINDYEELLKTKDKEPELSRLRTVKNLNNSDFWNPKSIETLIFNSYVGGASVFEFRNGKSEIIRANDQYTAELGKLISEKVQLKDSSITKFLDSKNKQILFDSIDEAIKLNKETSCEIMLTDGENKEYIHVTLREIANASERHLIYCVINNMTKQRETEKLQVENSEKLKIIMSNINCGISATVYNGGNINVIFSNECYYEMYGYTKNEVEKENINMFNLVISEDRERIKKIIENVLRDGGQATYEYRCKKRDGSIIWINCINTTVSITGYKENILLAVTTDVTAQHEYRKQKDEASDILNRVLDSVGSGLTAIELHGEKAEFILANDKFFDIIGYSRKSYFKANENDMFAVIHPDDYERVLKIVTECNSTKGETSIQYRIISENGEVKWIKSLISTTDIAGYDVPVQIAVFSDVTAEKETLDQLYFLNESAKDIICLIDSDAAINKTLENLRDYFDADRAYIVEIDYERKLTNNTYEICADGITSEINNLKNIPYEENDFWFSILINDEFVVIDDVKKLEDSKADLRELLLSQSINSIIIAPIWVGEILIGFAGIDNPKRPSNHVSRLKAISGYISMLITRRDMQLRIKKDSNAIKMMIDDTPGGFVRMEIHENANPTVVTLNDGFCNMLGLTYEETMEKYENDVLKCLYYYDLDRVSKQLATTVKDGGQCSIECRLLCKNGDYLWVMIFGRFINTGSKVFLNAYFTDVSAEHESELRQKELLDNLPCGAALYEFDGKYLHAIHINKHYWELVEREPMEYNDMSFLDAVFKDDRSIIDQEIRTAIRQKRDIDCKVRIKCGKSGYKPFHIIARVMSKENGNYLFYTSYSQISDSTMSIQEVLPIALSTMMSASGDISYVKDKDLHYISCSKLVVEALGYESEKDILGKTDYELFETELADSFTSLDKKILDECVNKIECIERIPNKDGNIHIANTSKYPILNSFGKVIGIYGISRDVTEQMERESQLELLTKCIPGGIATYSINSDGIHIMYFNDGYFNYSGYSRDEFQKIVEADPLALVFDKDKPKLIKLIKNYKKQRNGHEVTYTYRSRKKDGGYSWMNLYSVLSEISKDRYVVNVVQLDVTEQQEEKERIRLAEEEYRIATLHSGNTIGRYDIMKRTLTITEDASVRLNLPECIPDVPYGRVKLGRISPDTADVYIDFYENIMKGKKESSVTFKKLLSTGWRWITERATTIFDDEGKPISAIISYTDVTEQQEKETVYRKWQQNLQDRKNNSYTLFRRNLSKNTVFDYVEGNLIDFHISRPEEESFGERIKEFTEKCIFIDDRERYLKFINADSMLANYYRGKRSVSSEFRIKVSNGEMRWIKLTVELVEYPNTTDVSAYFMYEDINDVKLEELRTKVEAITDPLTGLLNRKAFRIQTNEAIKNKKQDTCCAVFLLDMDSFKTINDSFGHSKGDNLLISIGNEICSVIRDDKDFACRMGGDEFLIFLRDMPDKKSVLKKAEQLCSLAHKSFENDICTSVSLGIAISPDDGDDFESLYLKADKALYYVKENGKDGCAFYNPLMGK